MSPEVKKVKPNPDYTLTLTFDNGEIKVFDMKAYLDKSEFFSQLKDLELFNTAKPGIMGCVEWDAGQDLSPETLYLKSKKAEISKAVQA